MQITTVEKSVAIAEELNKALGNIDLKG